MYSHRLNKGFSLKFLDGYQIWYIWKKKRRRKNSEFIIMIISTVNTLVKIWIVDIKSTL